MKIKILISVMIFILGTNLYALEQNVIDFNMQSTDVNTNHTEEENCTQKQNVQCEPYSDIDINTPFDNLLPWEQESKNK